MNRKIEEKYTKKNHPGDKSTKKKTILYYTQQRWRPRWLKTQQRWRPNGLKGRASISRKNNQKNINMKTSNTMIM